MRFLQSPAFILLLLGTMVATASAKNLSEPTPAALEKVRQLEATRIGVDHLNNLWAWHKASGEVTLVAPDGSEVASRSVSGASAVQADAEWGIVSLSSDGSELRVLTWGQPAPVRIPLPDRSFDACWLGPDSVAVSPKLSAVRVEVWAVSTGSRVTAMGQEKEIQGRPGATKPRNIFLAVDAKSGELYSFDSYFGEVAVFDREGHATFRAGRRHPEQKQMDAHIAKLDERMRTEGRTELVGFLLWNGFALQDKSIWLIESCDTSSHEAHVVNLSRDGSREVVVPLGQPCCSGDRATVWGSWLIFYYEQMPQNDGCSNPEWRIDR